MDASRGPQGLEGSSHCSAHSHPSSQCTQHPCFPTQQAGMHQSTPSSRGRDLHPGTAARQLPVHICCLPRLWGPCSPLASSPAQRLQQPLPLSWRCCSSSAFPACPLLPALPALCPRHCPGTRSAAAPCCGAGARAPQAAQEGAAMAHGARGTRQSPEPPTCLRAARQARKSQRFLRSPGPGAFSSGTRWPQPNWGSSLAFSFQAGVGGLGSGLSCASPGCSPNPCAQGWAMLSGALLPGLARAAAVCSGRAAGQHRLPVPPASVQAGKPPRGKSRAGCWLPAAGGGPSHWC